MAMRDDVRTGRAGMGYWLVQGAIGGLIGGLVMAAFLMIYLALTMGAEAFFMPLRMIGAIVLGPAALEPAYPLLTALIAGVLVHMLLSAGFGMIFGALASSVPALLQSTVVTVTAAVVAGALLWLVNYYLIAAAAGWNWFLEGDQMLAFIAHAFMFGAPLGFYAAWAAQRAGVQAPSTATRGMAA